MSNNSLSDAVREANRGLDLVNAMHAGKDIEIELTERLNLREDASVISHAPLGFPVILHMRVSIRQGLYTILMSTTIDEEFDYSTINPPQPVEIAQKLSSKHSLSAPILFELPDSMQKRDPFDVVPQPTHTYPDFEMINLTEAGECDWSESDSAESPADILTKMGIRVINYLWSEFGYGVYFDDNITFDSQDITPTASSADSAVYMLEDLD